MSFNLWGVERNFPVLPIFIFFKTTIIAINKIALSILIGSLISVVLFDRKNSIFFLFTSLLYLLLEDQMRWQPWVYIYILTLFPFLFNTSKKNKINFLRMLFIGIYIWSGIHKLNPFFNELIIESFAVDFFRIQNLTFINLFKTFGYTVPILEIVSGVLLYFTSTRKNAALFIGSMHLFILLYLSPFAMNGNYIVYPWNIFMIIVVFLLFYNSTDKIKFSCSIWRKHKIIYTVLAFILTAPFLKFIGLWDNYTSFSLYSGDISNLYILSERSIPQLKKHEILQKHLYYGKIIDLGKWATYELMVPIPPEERIFNQLAKKLTLSNRKFFFLETKTPLWERKTLDKYSLKKEREKKEWIQELSPLIFKDSVTITPLRIF